MNVQYIYIFWFIYRSKTEKDDEVDESIPEALVPGSGKIKIEDHIIWWES